MLPDSYLARGLTLGALLVPLVSACSGTVEHIPGDKDGSGGRQSGSGGAHTSTGGFGASTTGGQPAGGSGGSQQNTGGKYEDPGCPHEDPPPPDYPCDPLDPYVGCGVGMGCYPWVSHPYGSGCGYQEFGSQCEPAGTGFAGDFCGDEHDWCAPGYLCVVGAGAGKTCQKLCSTTGASSGCAPGLFCGETDIEGYGVCF